MGNIITIRGRFDVGGPLLKYASDDKENILNISYPTFYSANRVASDEEAAAAEAAFLDSNVD